MKNFFLKNIWIHITRCKKDTGVIFSIVFCISFFLSLLFFFGFTKDLEQQLSENIYTIIEIKDPLLFYDRNELEELEKRETG